MKTFLSLPIILRLGVMFLIFKLAIMQECLGYITLVDHANIAFVVGKRFA